MGLEPCWGTGPDLGLFRPAQLRALGNGLISQQAQRALVHLLTDMAAALPSAAADEEDPR